MQLHRNQQQNAGDYVDGGAQDPAAQSRGYGRSTSAIGENANPSYQPNAGDNPPQDGAHPYVQTSSASDGESKSPMDSLMQALGKWGKKAEGMTGNMWGHLRTGPNMADTARGRMALGAKAFSEGGMGNVYRNTFDSAPDEQLLKTFACYLSTSSGLVPGTLFITSQKLAFCSDRPLAIPASPTSDDQGDPADDKHDKHHKRDKHSKKAAASKEQQDQHEMLYYKVTVPISQLQSVQPSENLKKKPPERYIQVTTVDGHEFWFMGFVNYEKGVKNLQDTMSLKERSPAGTPQAGAMGRTGDNTNPADSTEYTNEEFTPSKSKSPGGTNMNGPPSGNRDYQATDGYNPADGNNTNRDYQATDGYNLADGNNANRDYQATGGYNPADGNNTGDRDFQRGNNGRSTTPGGAYADPASTTTGYDRGNIRNPTPPGNAYADPSSTGGGPKDVNMGNSRHPSTGYGSEYANDGNPGYRTNESEYANTDNTGYRTGDAAASDNNYENRANPASTTSGPPPQNYDQ